MQILVRDTDADQALPALKLRMQRELKQRRFYEKPFERRNLEAQDAVWRARKQVERERLVAPRKRLDSMPRRPVPSTVRQQVTS